MEIKLLKQRAKEALGGKWYPTVLIIALLGILFGSLEGLLNLLIGVPISVGVSWLYLDIYDGKDTKVADIFKSFNYYLKVVGATLVMTIFLVLWSLLLFVPGIIKGFSYSQTLYLLKEDPNLGILEAITKSRQLMDGHKKRLFLTTLSFWPWVVIPFIGSVIFAWMNEFVLNINEIFSEIGEGTGNIVFGITSPLRFIVPFFSSGHGFMGLVVSIYGVVFCFYLLPYYNTTMAGFYRELVGNDK